MLLGLIQLNNSCQNKAVFIMLCSALWNYKPSTVLNDYWLKYVVDLC